MSVSVGRSKLHTALKELRIHWEHVCFRWKDGVARDFEERFWLPLDASTVSTITAMDRLGQVLLQVRQDCGREGEFGLGAADHS
jgi:hypothetical protein